MINIFTSFVNTIMAIVQFAINAINSLINLFVKIPTYVTFLTASLNVLPIIIIPFALAAIAIYVILFIVGR